MVNNIAPGRVARHELPAVSWGMLRVTIASRRLEVASFWRTGYRGFPQGLVKTVSAGLSEILTM